MSTRLRIACIRVPRPPTGEAAEAARLSGALLDAAPRVSPLGDLYGGDSLGAWADASGMERRGGDAAVAQALLGAAREAGFPEARVGIAGTCVAAAMATRERGSPWRVVPPGRDAGFVSRRALSLLPMEPDLREALKLLGLRTCGELARLDAAGIDLRFGAAGLRAWRLARGEDPRWPFRPPHPEQASAEAELEPPVATREPLRFLLRGLVGSVVAQIAHRQRIPAALRLVLLPDGGPEIALPLRSARPTAEERVWSSLGWSALEQMSDPGAPIAGMRLEAEEESAPRADQLDAFRSPAPDPTAVHTALLPLLGRWGAGALSRPRVHGAHLPEARAIWEAVGTPGISRLVRKRESEEAPPVRSDLALCLRRFPDPRPVRTVRDSAGRPTQFSVAGEREVDRGIYRITRAEGPERVSGQWWGSGYAREYWLVEDAEGRLWLLFRDGVGEEWRLEGWYD